MESDRGIRNSNASFIFPNEDYINRRVEFRFSGENLVFDLSLGLFSSLSIDSGSKLLLKTVAQQIDLDNLHSIADIGCGVGVLGISLAKRCPSARVKMVDRDALALSFSYRNANLNKVRNTDIQSALMLENDSDSPFDLILSNFPAKAGETVLADFLKNSLVALGSGAAAAIVIVNTLAERCGELIKAAGAEIVYSEASKQHTVFHYKALHSPITEKSGILSPYIRHRGRFKLKRTAYSLETVWNVSDFDTLSWRLQLLGDMLDREAHSGPMLFWAPGQGHLPVAVCLRHGARPKEVILAGRDRLQLLISKSNLEAAEIKCPVDIVPLPAAELLGNIVEPQSISLLVTDIEPVARTQWAQPLRKSAQKLLAPNGIWALVGRSSDIATLTKTTGGFTPINDRRKSGWRALVLRRNP